MLDLTSSRGKIIDAAMRLAASEGWAALTLSQIANEAGVSLPDFRKEFTSKADILAAFVRGVDDAVLAKVTPADADMPKRDRLFDVLMSRFELMTPYRPGLRRIAADLRRRPGESVAQLGVAARSVYWMLAAAGIDAEGARGALRVPGVMSIYARAFDIWLEDDDPGLARTMAALDSRLRRGERFIQRLDDMGAAASRLFNSLKSAGVRRGAHSPVDDIPPASNESRPPQPPQPPSGGEPGPAPAM